MKEVNYNNAEIAGAEGVDQQFALGAVGTKVLHRAGFLAVAERLLAGDFLSDEDVRSLAARAAPPVLAKLVSIMRVVQPDLCPKVTRIRPVVLLNAAEALETKGLQAAKIELAQRLDSVQESGVSTNVFAALDRWTGDFTLGELVEFLKHALPEDFSARGFKILGPSTSEIKLLVERHSGRRSPGFGMIQVLELLHELGVTRVEGGGDLSIHRAALAGGFEVAIGQRVEFHTSSDPRSGQYPLSKSFVDELLLVRRELAPAGKVTAWFPWAVSSSSTQLIRAIALGRLALRSVPRIRAPLSLLGPNVAQAALEFGANDVGFAAVDSYTAQGLGICPLSEIEFLELDQTQIGGLTIPSNTDV